MTVANAKRTLAAIGAFVTIRRLAQARCRACGEDGATVSIDPSS